MKEIEIVKMMRFLKGCLRNKHKANKSPTHIAAEIYNKIFHKLTILHNRLKSFPISEKLKSEEIKKRVIPKVGQKILKLFFIA